MWMNPGRGRVTVGLLSIAIIATVFAGLPATPALAVGGASISGTVTAPTGEPVAGVRVVPLAGDHFVDMVTTAADGTFSITGLAAGEYRLAFDPGAGSPYLMGLAYQGGTDLELADVFTLAADEHRTVNVELERGAVISGTVTGPDGVGIPRVFVALDSSDWGHRETYTAADGTYAFVGLLAGEYRLFFGPTGTTPYLPEFYSGKTDPEAADPVVIHRGEARTVDVALRPDPLGGSISGRVTNGDGDPIPEVLVAAMDGPNVGTATTAADGTYTIWRLPAGSYIVGFIPPPESPYLQEFHQDKDFLSADPVALGSGQQLEGIDASLTRGATISGRVTGTDGSGRPGGALAGVTVSAAGPVSRQATTNADGSYLITGLTAGEYQLSFSPAAPYLPEYHAGKVDPDSADPVALGLGEDRTIDALLSRGATISGRVTGLHGESLAGVAVNLQPYPFRSTATGADGTYTFYDLPAGEYKVGFNPGWTPSGYVAEWYLDQPDPATATPVILAARERRFGVDASLTKRASLSGIVTGPDGAPLPDISVSVYGPSFGTARTAADGSYTVPDLLPGDYKVEFSTPAWSNYLGEFYEDAADGDSAATVSLSQGDRRTGIDAELAWAGRITGRVTGAGGEPLAGVLVNAGQRAAITAFDGTYTLPTLSTGTYTVTFASPDPMYLPLTLTTTVGPGEVVTLDAAMILAAQISGKVTSNHFRAVGEVTVQVLDAAGGVVGQAGVAADGSWVVGGLAPGTYVVYFAPGPGNPHRAEYWKDAKTFARAERITLAAGQTRVKTNAELKAQ